MKTQIKKSISLFLAVLMVLSCWVWVAPTEANADHTTGQYYFKYTAKIRETGNLGSFLGDNKMTVYYTKTDGTTGSKDFTPNKSNMQGSVGSTYTYVEGYIDGFPTSASWYIKLKFKSFASVYFSIEDAKYMVGKNSSSATNVVSNVDAYKWNCTASDTGGTSATFTLSTTGGNPYIKTADPGSAEEITIPSLDSTSTLSTSAYKPTCWDQYGVKWLGAIDPVYSISDSTTVIDTDLSNKENGFYAEEDSSHNGFAKITKAMQSGFPLGVGETQKDYYLIAAVTNSNGDIVSSYKKITVKYPTYNLQVKPNGGTLIYSDGSTSADIWTSTGVYGYEKTPYPTGEAVERKGYDFHGIWSVPQPTSGDASPDAADFAIPKTEAEWNAIDGTADGSIKKDADGKKYYKVSGTKWTEDARKVNGDKTYHAWWSSSDITVKFYDIDGTYLGSIIYKYGQTIGSKTAFTAQASYQSGAFTYETFKNWRDIDGTDITSTFKFGAGEPENVNKTTYSLTPVYETKTYLDNYKITFNMPDGSATEMKNLNYRVEITPPTATVPGDLAGALDYSYRFKGWTAQAPANDAKYHLVDVGNTAISINNDWTVRTDATYYPVIERTVKEYYIKFNYINATGENVSVVEKVAYGSVITTPVAVNRTYATEGYEYPLEAWKTAEGTNYLKVDFPIVDAVSGNDKYIALNSDNFVLSSANLSESNPIVLDAAYGTGVEKPYTLTFKYKNENGADASKTIEVTHGYFISGDAAELIRELVPTDYSDANHKYYFQYDWAITEGMGTTEATNCGHYDLESFSPVSNVTFEAIYDEGTPYYTVKYVFGAQGYEERVLLGELVPAWIVEGTEDVFTPIDEEVSTGTFVFDGWYDEEQKDADRKQTNGNKYIAQNENYIVTGDLTLYPQYKFEPKKFEIKFMNFDGSVQLAIAEVEIGQSFEAAFAEAQRAAQYRAPDEKYKYTFIGWDNKVPDNYLCEGKDVTYTALYRTEYVYYTAQWLTAEDGTVAVTSNHTYDSQVYNPAVDFEIPTGMAFAGWCYRDANGVEQSFVRGMKITSDMTFYATYVEATVTYTVTTVVNGETATYEVAANKKAEVVPTPVSGYKDETYHQAFKGWYTDAACTAEFNIDKTAITENITIYAKYETEMHSTLVEGGNPERALIKAPDFAYKYENADDAKGQEKIWCSCSEATAQYIDIDPLEDTIAPTGVIYLGGGKWSSTEGITGAADTNAYYVNDDDMLIITVTDTADVDNAYNPSGRGTGIKLVRAFVSSDTFTQQQQGNAAQLATTIFTAKTENGEVVVENAANFTYKVSELQIGVIDAQGNIEYKPLEDGKEYIVYYFAMDNSGKILNTNVRTAKFTYDVTAPEIKLEGEEDNKSLGKIKTYCESATIIDIEAGATVAINGVDVAADEIADGTYEITESGEYMIEITDIAGNSRVKKIKVAEHNVITKDTAATCTVDGSKVVKCAVCGEVFSEETFTAPGHDYDYKTTTATCTEPSIKTGKCKVCDAKAVEEIVAPALGHSFAMDAGWVTEENGNYEYATDAEDAKITKTEDGVTYYQIWVVRYEVETEPTCSTDGLKVAVCENGCGEKVTAVIDATPDANHVWGPIKTVRPTCTEVGYKYQTCKYCPAYDRIGDDIAETGHASTETLVTVYPTCNTAGAQVERCTKCGAYVGDETAIPATGKHKWVASEDPTETFDATTEAEGQITYRCANEGCNAVKVEKVDKVVKYTVNFYLGSEEETAAKSFEDVTVGYTIEEKDVENLAPVKASDTENTYKFAGWAANGKAVKFPFDVEGDMEIYPVFKASTRIYTHKFYVTTVWGDENAARTTTDEVYAEIIGVYGETNKAPATKPSFNHYNADKDAELKSLYTFKFLGWSETGTAANIEENFEMTDDKTYHAVFAAVPNNFTVIFYDEDGRTVLDSTSVPTNGSATYTGETPEKAADSENHYTFAGWSYNNELKDVYFEVTGIKENTKLYAKYTAVAHTFAKYSEYGEDGNDTLNYEATCKAEGLKTEKCECGYVVTTKLPMKEHVYVEQEDGSLKCVCGDTIEAETKKVTIKFVDDEGNVLKLTEVAEGKSYTYSAPDKAKTAQYTYAFAFWKDADNVVVSSTKSITVVAGATDATYTAVYTGTTCVYNIIYFDANGDIADSFSVEYGKSVPAYSIVDDDGNVVYPAKKYNDNYHYEFKEWNLTKGSDALTVKGQTEFKPVYTAVDHKFVTQTVPATCTTTGGEKDICACGCEKVIGQVLPTIPHQVGTILEKVEPALGKAGYMIYTCSMWKGEIREDYAALKSADLKIRVYDENGNAINNAAVELYYTVNGEEVRYIVEKNGVVIDDYLTDAAGYIAVAVPAEYSGWYAKIYFNGGSYSGALKTGDAENVFGNPKTTTPDDDNNDKDENDGCSCTCHKDTFWGIIFRIFQKIVKMFAGKPKCCDNPDSRI